MFSTNQVNGRSDFFDNRLASSIINTGQINGLTTFFDGRLLSSSTIHSGQIQGHPHTSLALSVAAQQFRQVI